jgi:hypothetical protein
MASRMNILWMTITATVVVAAAGGTRWLVRAAPPSALKQGGFSFPLHADAANATAAQGDIRMRVPDGPPRIATGEFDSLGRPVTVSCASCHSNLTPNPARRSASDLTEFHQGLTFAHGQLSCLSCHNSGNFDLLRLVDGSDLDYRDVRMLCSQCHMPQSRDWEHSAHGGVNGFWDPARGLRIRKICIDCHDPHAPKFPPMRPTFKPRDRFLSPPDAQHAGDDS